LNLPLGLTFYMDVHVPRAITLALRLRGIDVVTAQEDGSAELGDGQLLARATELRRTLVSQDDDLLREAARLHREHQDFSGLVYAHQLRITIGQMVDDLELIAKATMVEDWWGKIEFYLCEF
jgi:hypothetical protein